MNSASQDFPRHLAVLRERMLHPTDYEKAVHYFLEEFAGDAARFMGIVVTVESSSATTARSLITVGGASGVR